MHHGPTRAAVGGGPLHLGKSLGVAGGGYTLSVLASRGPTVALRNAPSLVGHLATHAAPRAMGVRSHELNLGKSAEEVVLECDAFWAEAALRAAPTRPVDETLGRLNDRVWRGALTALGGAADGSDMLFGVWAGADSTTIAKAAASLGLTGVTEGSVFDLYPACEFLLWPLCVCCHATVCVFHLAPLTRPNSQPAAPHRPHGAPRRVAHSVGAAVRAGSAQCAVRHDDIHGTRDGRVDDKRRALRPRGRGRGGRAAHGLDAAAPARGASSICLIVLRPLFLRYDEHCFAARAAACLVCFRHVACACRRGARARVASGHRRALFALSVRSPNPFDCCAIRRFGSSCSATRALSNPSRALASCTPV